MVVKSEFLVDEYITLRNEYDVEKFLLLMPSVSEGYKEALRPTPSDAGFVSSPVTREYMRIFGSHE